MKETIMRYLIILAVVAALPWSAMALTQTVNPADSAATIQAAIDAVLASADASGEVVFNPGTYVLSASLTVNVNSDGNITLRGSDPNNRPIIVCPNYVGATADDGAISIGGTGTTVTVKDMIILPPDVPGQPFANPETIGIGGRVTLANCTLNFINLLIVGNNGSNQPVTTTGDINANPANFPNITRFENACVNIVSGVNASTLIVGATNVITCHGGAEGFWISGNATTGGPLEGHYYDCVFNWNQADGFRHERIGQDDRFYRCQFNYNGDGSGANQGIHNSGWNPGGRFDGVGGHSYFEGCEASYNRDRGFYMGASETSTIIDCTAIDNGNFFPTISDSAFGIDFVTGQGHFLSEDCYCRGNRGPSLNAALTEGGAGSDIVIRRLRSDGSAVNNTYATETYANYKSAITFGGENALVEDCYINDTQAIGIWHDPSTAVGGTGSVIIRRNTVQNTGQSGILGWRNHSNRTVLVEDCVLYNVSNDPNRITTSVNRGNGIIFRAPVSTETIAGDVTIRRCFIDGAGIGTIDTTGCGIRVEAQASGTSGTVVISECAILNTTNAGICVAGGIVSVTDVSVSFNEFGSGIQVLDADPLTMSNVTVSNASPHGITIGLAGGLPPLAPIRLSTLDHLLLAQNHIAGLYILSNQSNSPPGWTLSNSTLYNNPVGLQMEASNFASQAATIEDSIIAGAGGIGVQVLTTVVNPITIRNTGLVTAGPDALAVTTQDLGNNPTIITVDNASVLNIDPVFASTDPNLATYLDVRSDGYGTKGTGGTNLSGWGDYIGDVVGIEAWRRF